MSYLLRAIEVEIQMVCVFSVFWVGSMITEQLHLLFKVFSNTAIPVHTQYVI